MRGCRKEAVTLSIQGFYYTMDTIEHCQTPYIVHGVVVYRVGHWLGILVDMEQAKRIVERNRASYEEYSQPEPAALVPHQFQTRPELQVYYECINESGLLLIDWYH